MDKSEKTKKVHKIVMACTNGMGEPDFAFVKVACDDISFYEGEHYDTAQEYAKLLGYEGPFVCFDEKDMCGGLSFLSEYFIWESATTVTI